MPAPSPHPISIDCVGAWRFDELNRVDPPLDSSLAGMHLSWVSGGLNRQPPIVAGVVGNARNWDPAESQYGWFLDTVTVPAITMNVLGDAFTVAGRATWDGTITTNSTPFPNNGRSVLFGFVGSCTAGYIWAQVCVEQAHGGYPFGHVRLEYIIQRDAGGFVTELVRVCSFAPLSFYTPLDTWFHWMATWDKNTGRMTFHVNSLPVIDHIVGPPINSLYHSMSPNFGIGSLSGCVSSGWRGKIDDAVLYTAAKTIWFETGDTILSTSGRGIQLNDVMWWNGEQISDTDTHISRSNTYFPGAEKVKIYVYYEGNGTLDAQMYIEGNWRVIASFAVTSGFNMFEISHGLYKDGRLRLAFTAAVAADKRLYAHGAGYPRQVTASNYDINKPSSILS